MKKVLFLSLLLISCGTPIGSFEDTDNKLSKYQEKICYTSEVPDTRCKCIFRNYVTYSSDIVSNTPVTLKMNPDKQIELENYFLKELTRGCN